MRMLAPYSVILKKMFTLLSSLLKAHDDKSTASTTLDDYCVDSEDVGEEERKLKEIREAVKKELQELEKKESEKKKVRQNEGRNKEGN